MVARTALITGALGQDGVLLAESLLSRGYRVVGVVRAGRSLPIDGPLTEVHFTSIDLCDPIAIRSLLDEWRPNEVYHLAAFHHSSQERSSSTASASREEILNVNFLATKSLAFALLEAKADCHLVFASSSQVFTAVDMIHIVNESSPRHPSTFYGHAKSWSMDLLDFLRRESGLRASSVILFNHESTRRSTQFVSRKITRAAAMAACGERVDVQLQNIGSRVDWSSAHDVVHALSLIGQEQAPKDYTVASGQLHSVRQLLEIAFDHVGLDWKRFATFQEERATPALVGETQTLEHLTAWRRAVRFEDMVTEMVDHDRSTFGTQAA